MTLPASELTYTARAKVNLALHITGRREDGYHLLDSLVAFADYGDVITCRKADALSLTASGPFARNLPAPSDNIMWQAATRLHSLIGSGAWAQLHIEKQLPAGAGLGGGSADAAATIRALTELWGHAPTEAELHLLALTLGADVPVCLHGQPVRMRGIGDHFTPLTYGFALPCVLVYPNYAMSTPIVFAAYDKRYATGQDRPKLPPLPPSHTPQRDFIHWLMKHTENSLEPIAVELAPVIGDTLAELRHIPHCLGARMSGSGSACVGLFSDETAAEVAAKEIGVRHPDYWVTATTLHC